MSVSSWLQKARGTFDMASTALSALELIGQLAGGKIAAATSKLDVLELIGQIVDHVKAGITGTASPEAVRDAINKMRADLTGNNATVDAEADEKFPRG